MSSCCPRCSAWGGGDPRFFLEQESTETGAQRESVARLERQLAGSRRKLSELEAADRARLKSLAGQVKILD